MKLLITVAVVIALLAFAVYTLIAKPKR